MRTIAILAILCTFGTFVGRANADDYIPYQPPKVVVVYIPVYYSMPVYYQTPSFGYGNMMAWNFGYHHHHHSHQPAYDWMPHDNHYVRPQPGHAAPAPQHHKAPSPHHHSGHHH